MAFRSAARGRQASDGWVITTLSDAEKLAFRSLSVNMSKTVADTAKVIIND